MMARHTTQGFWDLRKPGDLYFKGEYPPGQIVVSMAVHRPSLRIALGFFRSAQIYYLTEDVTGPVCGMTQPEGSNSNNVTRPNLIFHSLTSSCSFGCVEKIGIDQDHIFAAVKEASTLCMANFVF